MDEVTAAQVSALLRRFDAEGHGTIGWDDFLAILTKTCPMFLVNDLERILIEFGAARGQRLGYDVFFSWLFDESGLSDAMGPVEAARFTQATRARFGSGPALTIENIDSVSRQSSMNVAEELSKRGFALAQLLQFVEDNGLGTRCLTTASVVRDIVIPQTAGQQCSFAEIFPAFEGLGAHYRTMRVPFGPKSPFVFVSHAWDTPFLNTVKTITQFAAGKESLESRDYTEEQLNATFWLCIFAVNQHSAICGTDRNPCNCGSAKILPPNPQSELDKFDGVMQNIEKHVVAMDRALNVLKRVWVLAEIGAAIRMGKDTLFLGSLSEEVILQGITSIPMVQDGEATDQSDRDRILNDIDMDIGFDEFNRRVRQKIGAEVEKFRVFELLQQGKYEAMLDLVEKDKTLLQATDMRHDDSTILHLLVQKNDAAELVERVLELRADPNTPTSSGLTPLHVVTSPHGSPHFRRELSQSLLDARADIDAKSPLRHSPKDLRRLSDDFQGLQQFDQIPRTLWPQSCPSRGTVERRISLHRCQSVEPHSIGDQSSDNEQNTPESNPSGSQKRFLRHKTGRLMFRSTEE